MKAKKYIKLKVDMYEDTKFKIIDTMESRDTINYIWTRILALCGKINNDEGELIISKNMIYTAEILALEFNRSIEQVENAINVFIDLNMMSKDKNDVLSVCNWRKHQGKKKNDVKEERNDIKSNVEINKNKNKENSQKHDIKKKCDEIKVEKLKRVKTDTNDTKDQIIDYSGGTKEKIINNMKVKPIRNKKKKRKIDEVIVRDISGNEDFSDMCGIDMEDYNLGKVIASFDFT